MEEGAVKIAHTAAFELCSDGSCSEPRITSDGKSIWCHLDQTCRKGGCYCQLFRRAKDAAADDPWLVAPVNHEHEAKNEPDKWNYKCLCVLPIFEVTHSDGGVDYKARLQLCATGDCALTRTKGLGAPDQLTCSGDCADTKCKCTLFRLSTSAKPADAKWELVAKGGKTVDHAKGYYYRCFCLK